MFGALPGPRNLPLDKQGLPNRQTSIIASITFRTDGEHLASLLPLALPVVEILSASLTRTAIRG